MMKLQLITFYNFKITIFKNNKKKKKKKKMAN